MSTTQIPRVLSIAGTDPTGGAGLQADLKSFAANGAYGMGVVTALVAQNTQGVRSVHIPPVSFLKEQLLSVSDDVTIDAVKIGMLANAEIIQTVSDWLGNVAHGPVVLDPVMVATSGDRLLSDEAESALRSLLPEADLITPNIPELAVLAKRKPAEVWIDVIDQAKTVAERYDVQVLAKGGHLDSDTVYDALVSPEGAVTQLEAPRVDTHNTHGTGCSLSSAVAALYPRTQDWAQAVAQAKLWLTESLRAADELHVGRGHGPVNHFATLWSRDG